MNQGGSWELWVRLAGSPRYQRAGMLLTKATVEWLPESQWLEACWKRLQTGPCWAAKNRRVLEFALRSGERFELLGWTLVTAAMARQAQAPQRAKPQRSGALRSSWPETWQVSGKAHRPRSGG
jgi:hypothetical protein